MTTSTVERTGTKPICPCCGGEELHYEYAVAIGRPSPDDADAPCTTCNGTGRSWHRARRNSCEGFRSLQRTRR